MAQEPGQVKAVAAATALQGAFARSERYRLRTSTSDEAFDRSSAALRYSVIFGIIPPSILLSPREAREVAMRFRKTLTFLILAMGLAFALPAWAQQKLDRGRETRLDSGPPPSEPDRRISRIRLSSRWFYLEEE